MAKNYARPGSSLVCRNYSFLSDRYGGDSCDRGVLFHIPPSLFSFQDGWMDGWVLHADANGLWSGKML